MRKLLGSLHGQGHPEPLLWSHSWHWGTCTLHCAGMAETIGRTCETCSPTTLPFSELEEGVTPRTPRFSAPRSPHLLSSLSPGRQGQAFLLYLPASQDAPRLSTPDLPLATPKELRKSFLHAEVTLQFAQLWGIPNKNLADVQNSAACSSKIPPLSPTASSAELITVVLPLGHRKLG